MQPFSPKYSFLIWLLPTIPISKEFIELLTFSTVRDAFSIMSSIDNIGKIALQCGLGMKVLELRILSSTIREDLFTKLFASTCKIIVRGDLCNKGYRQ